MFSFPTTALFFFILNYSVLFTLIIVQSFIISNKIYQNFVFSVPHCWVAAISHRSVVDNVRKRWRRVCCSYDGRHETGATAIFPPPLSRKQEKIMEQFLYSLVILFAFLISYSI